MLFIKMIAHYATIIFVDNSIADFTEPISFRCIT